MRLFRTRKSRKPAPSRRISTLSNATTLHPLMSQTSNPSDLAPVLNNFPVPPTTLYPAPPAYQYTNLPNISQLSVDTLADPIGRRPDAPNRLSSYEAFITHAREQEFRRLERIQRMIRAEERRRMLAAQASRSWPHDPWRGGFGPPSGSAGREVGLGLMGTPMASRPTTARRKTSGSGIGGVKVWLRRVTSRERL